VLTTASAQIIETQIDVEGYGDGLNGMENLNKRPWVILDLHTNAD
jgi:hypothetical protein